MSGVCDYRTDYYMHCFYGTVFSIFGLFTYYMFQPYNADGTVRSFRYYMPSLLMYALCYGCIL